MATRKIYIKKANYCMLQICVEALILPHRSLVCEFEEIFRYLDRFIFLLKLFDSDIVGRTL